MFNPGDDDARHGGSRLQSGMQAGRDCGSVLGDKHPTVPQRALQYDLVIRASQARLLDRDDIQPRTDSSKSPQNVMAGVLVPEESNYC